MQAQQSENGSSSNSSSRISGPDYSGWKKGKWSVSDFVIVGASFFVFWPVGLFLVFWKIRGGSIGELPSIIADKVSSMTTRQSRRVSASGNVVFDDYQQTQKERIEEIKTEMRDRWHRFNSFKHDEQRNKDREEFDRFMSQSNKPTAS